MRPPGNRYRGGALAVVTVVLVACGVVVGSAKPEVVPSAVDSAWRAASGHEQPRTTQRRHRRGRRGRRGPRGLRGPAGPAGPAGPKGPTGDRGSYAHGGYIRETFSNDIEVPAGGNAEGAVRCGEDSFSQVPASGGAYFLDAPATSEAGVVATYPAVVQPDGTFELEPPDPAGSSPERPSHANGWFARATNASGSPRTLRIFVTCFGGGP